MGRQPSERSRCSSSLSCVRRLTAPSMSARVGYAGAVHRAGCSRFSRRCRQVCRAMRGGGEVCWHCRRASANGWGLVATTSASSGSKLSLRSEPLPDERYCVRCDDVVGYSPPRALHARRRHARTDEVCVLRPHRQTGQGSQTKRSWKQHASDEGPLLCRTQLTVPSSNGKERRTSR